MMSGSEERWREGSSGTAGALGHLLERVANDLTPQHDSQHYYQSGFIPSVTPPWTTSSQTPLTSLGSAVPPLQQAHTSLGTQCGLPPNHTNIGSQVPPMQSSHSNMGPKMSPMQPPTTSAPGPMPSGPPLAGSSARSYSVSQDLFNELDGSRSPLFRSSSDLGLRLNHSHTLGSHFGDGRLDGFMDSSMDSLDGMLVGGHDPSYYLEIQRRPSAAPGTPPLQTDQQTIPPTPVPHPEFSFYSHENDCMMEGESSNSISAKFSNITGTAASLGSWFSPFDPFRSNLTSASTKTAGNSQVSSVGTGCETAGRSEQLGPMPNSGSGNQAQSSPSQPGKTNKPSYSDVLSKNPVQEGKASAGSSQSNRNAGNNTSMTTNPQQSPSPSPAPTRPEQKSRSQAASNVKLNKPRNSSTVSTPAVSNISNGGNNNQGSKHGKGDGNTNSRVGLDDFDLNEGSLSNGILSAYEHYDWGETSSSSIIGNGPTKLSTNSPTHQTKWISCKSETKKTTPEKISNSGSPLEVDMVKGSDHLNNKITFMQQKQPPKRPPYINNNLSASNCSPPPCGSSSVTSGRGNSTQTSVNPATPSPNHGSSSTSASFASANNSSNNNQDRSCSSKAKSTLLSKEEKKSPDNGSVGSTSRGSRRKVLLSRGGERTNPQRRNPPCRRKATSLIHSELVSHGLTMCVQWAALAVRAVVWLGTLATDVVVMSSRLVLHLLTLIWGHMQEYWGSFKVSVAHYWRRLTTVFTRKDKEEKRIPGRDKKVSGGLECNISLPTTGEEAMKRLLACKGKDPYSILGVTRDCTDDDIKKYYKRQAFLVHPDKNKQPGAEEAFKILAHAFEIIGEPERRSEYDVRLAEEVQLEGAWGELASLLTRLQEKLDEAANTIRCTNCNKRHRRVKLPRPIYAARDCAECKIHHAAREGDIWAESSMLGLRWRYYACMEGAVYDISDWAACQSDHLKHLQANTHSVQYRIVSGKKNPPSKNSTPEFPSDPDLEEFFNNLCKEKFGKNYSSGSSQAGGQQMPDTRKRKGKKKK